MARKFCKLMLLSVVLSSVLFGGIAQAQLPIPIPAPPMQPFALESGHPLAQVVIPRLIPVLIQDVSMAM